MASGLMELIEEARKATARSYCPYSKTPVGAAVLTADGTVITGAKVETATLCGTVCAELSAVVRAIAEGYLKFVAIAIAHCDSNDKIYPCGSCRQFLSSFGDIRVVIVSNENRQPIETSTAELLPRPYCREKRH
ncbi:hypothetical protein AB6A40_008522 [Gnathostoma spinigerum]|uniref:CMP/dCMP-type deaminase domain-containing protein n=1 Tax=Gnathostoma spinigerum TaxID=75299 RepID=A0ABD6EPM2_9BILA